MKTCTTDTFRHLVSLAVCFLLGSAMLEVRGLEPATRLSQYAHRAWHIGDAGLLGTPQSIAQTSDGYIWISTSNGLFRFDGVQFRQWVPPTGESLPSNSLWYLYGAKNGSLYVGTDRGLARIAQGRVHNYPGSPRWAGPFVEDVYGTVWMGVSGVHSPPSPLCKVWEDSLKCLGLADGFQCVRGLSNTVDPAGEIWIGSSEGTCRWSEGSPPSHEDVSAVERQHGLRAVTSLAATSDGVLWAGTQHSGEGEGLLRFANGSWSTYVAPAVEGNRLAVSYLFAGRNNGLWIGTADDGLYRLWNGKLDHFGPANGLSGRRVLSILEDREGGFWVVTPMGIDYFRDYAVRSFPSSGDALEDRAYAVAAQGEDVYLGGESLLRLRGGDATQVTDSRHMPVEEVQFLYSDSRKNLWIGAGKRLLVMPANGPPSEIEGFSGTKPEIAVYITEALDHDIWVSSENLATKQSSLLRIHDRRVVDRFPSEPGVGDQVMNALAPNPQGGVWVGGAQHGLYWFHGGHFQRTLAEDFNGRVENLWQEPGKGLWIVTPSGFIRYADGEAKKLDTTSGLPCTGAVNIQSDRHGSLWFYMHCGILRVPDTVASEWWAMPDRRISGRFIGPLEGARPNLFDGSPAETTDGELWSANGYEFQVIDSHHLPFNPIPPPVIVEGVLADGKQMPRDHGLLLPPNTRELQIDYSGLSFLIPDQVRFRYLLHGHDTHWVEAGARRQAFYNDLPPAHYTFQVTACNNNGVWNKEGAAVAFDVMPAWYQTMWFRVLAVLLGISLLVVGYLLRLNRYAASLKIRFHERLEERTRLARDLHDTLLQTIQGSKLVADDARELGGNPPNTARALDRLSAWLEKAVFEGRAALEALRGATLESDSLIAALRRAADDTVFASDLKITASSHGIERELHPIARDEIYRIGHEAMRNAQAHSGGTAIDVSLHYRRRSLQLVVHDNGRGMDPGFTKVRKSGHFGMTGMRERALLLGGTLDIASAPDAGTKVSLHLPGKAVYLTQPWRPSAYILRALRALAGKFM